MEELSDKELLLILNKNGYNFNIKNEIVDSEHHSYKKRKKIGFEYEIDDEEAMRAFEQFKQDLDED